MQYTPASLRILDTALNLFSEQGYHLTTTKQIAQIAEVNELTIFRNFNSKANLFQCAAEKYIETSDLENVLTEGLEEKSIEEKLYIIIERCYKLYKDNIKFFKIQLKLTDNEADFVKLKMSRKIRIILLDYFQHLVDTNELKGNIELMVSILITFFIGMLTIEVLTDYEFISTADEIKIKEMTNIIVALYKA